MSKKVHSHMNGREYSWKGRVQLRKSIGRTGLFIFLEDSNLLFLIRNENLSFSHIFIFVLYDVSISFFSLSHSSSFFSNLHSICLEYLIQDYSRSFTCVHLIHIFFLCVYNEEYLQILEYHKHNMQNLFLLSPINENSK